MINPATTSPLLAYRPNTNGVCAPWCCSTSKSSASQLRFETQISTKWPTWKACLLSQRATTGPPHVIPLVLSFWDTTMPTSLLTTICRLQKARPSTLRHRTRSQSHRPTPLVPSPLPPNSPIFLQRSRWAGSSCHTAEQKNRLRSSFRRFETRQGPVTCFFPYCIFLSLLNFSLIYAQKFWIFI